ncbi:hypothetical protein [Erythrobacter neustonensis]|uniref:Uncharacterized protein n=1 Tax=Erythrobacter neustonensis TaxID=1112 RepID=A0A192D491_9SPHN|nr:hypothetical protein [Erythrobacter neustonensis]ANK13298.1 hypothetical protein A9D12_10505 [Erythrobacter neustonensis]
MLSTAITVLFTFTGVFAIIAIGYALRDARAVYAALLREGQLLRAGLAEAQPELHTAKLPAPRRVIATPRPALAQPRLRPAYAAA